MVASVLGVVAVVAIGLLIAGALQPLILVIVAIIAGLPALILLTSGLFRHAAPSANTTQGPAVPSSGDASYEPIEDPAQR